MKDLQKLLLSLPVGYEEHTNPNTIYNTIGNSELGTDYSIEIIDDKYEVRHTGNTIMFYTIDEVLEYIS